MSKTKAEKRVWLHSMMLGAVNLAALFGTSRYVRHHHPEGAALYVCAALPWFAMCGVIVSIALYLRKERDGYRRELAMRCTLWGAAASMAVNLYLANLRMLGWKGQAPLFLELYAFAGAMLLARIAYSVSNRPECGREEKYVRKDA